MKAQVQAPRALHPGLHTWHWTPNLGLTKNNNNYSGITRRKKCFYVYGGTRMRDIVGPHPTVALDWTPDWTRERTLDSGPWTITGVIHGPGIHVLYTSGKKGERVGYGWEWGNAWSTFNKSSFRYTRFWYTLGLWLVYFDISCQHSEVHYLDWKCDAVAMRCYTSGSLESVVKCFEISNIIPEEQEKSFWGWTDLVKWK